MSDEYAVGIPGNLPPSIKELITEIVCGGDNVHTCLRLAYEACRLRREADLELVDEPEFMRRTALVVPKVPE